MEVKTGRRGPNPAGLSCAAVYEKISRSTWPR